jgi:hypothetical protein
MVELARLHGRIGTTADVEMKVEVEIEVEEICPIS